MKHQILTDLISTELNQSTETRYLTDKVEFDHRETVKSIIRAKHNTFKVKQKGKAFYYDIAKSRVDTAVKKIDYNTKDVVLEIEEGEFERENLMLQSELRQFMYDTGQGVKFNELVSLFPGFGSVVAKRTFDDRIWRLVRLENLHIVDSLAEGLENTTTIEEYEYNDGELRRKTEGWENVAEALKTCNSADDNETPKYYIFERYGEMSVNMFNEINEKPKEKNGDDKYIQTFAVVAIKRNTNIAKISEMGNEDGIILFLEENEGYTGKDGVKRFKPYKELHWDEYDGKWLRNGYYYILRFLQDRANILANQIYESMKWSSKHVLWSNDKKIAGKNVISALKNGQILNATDLQVLNLAERNLSAHVEEWNRINELADKLTQSFEVATGEKLPSSTTLGQVEIQTATVGQYFEFKRQKLGLFLEEIFNDWVLPELFKKISPEHILEIKGDPNYMTDYFNNVATSQLFKKITANPGVIPPKEAIQMIKEDMVNEMMRKPKHTEKIRKDYYKGLKARARIVISGESLDRQNRITNGMALANLYANQAITQNPQSMSILSDITSKLGFKVDPSRPQEPPQPAMAGAKPPQAELTAE